MKNYKTPGCQYNPEGVQCDPNGRHCERCGHNPEVAAARLQKFQMKDPGGPSYITALRHLPPDRPEIYMLGNWGSPEAIKG